MKILSYVLYGLLGLVLSCTPLEYTDWQFWAILVNVMFIDMLGFVEGIGYFEKGKE